MNFIDWVTLLRFPWSSRFLDSNQIRWPCHHEAMVAERKIISKWFDNIAINFWQLWAFQFWNFYLSRSYTKIGSDEIGLLISEQISETTISTQIWFTYLVRSKQILSDTITSEKWWLEMYKFNPIISAQIGTVISLICSNPILSNKFFPKVK